MDAQDVLKGISNLKDTHRRNIMGCLEDWYDFFYAIRETFTPDEIKGMSQRELELLERLSKNIQEGLY